MSAGAESESRGPRFRPGRWLLDRGWWFLPAMLSTAIALPWVFGDRWYSDASYYQALATRMVRGGDWWSMMQGDLHYFNKPPLAFWIHAILIAMFGQADWAAHAPEAAFYVATCLLVGWLGKRLHGPLTGVLAGCAMALTNDWIWRISNFKLDFLHTLLLVAACACWVRAFVAGRPAPGETARRAELGWCAGAGLCIGGALMTKPLIGLGLPVLGVAWLALAGLFSPRRLRGLVLSAAVGAAIALPWHASMAWMYGREFTRTYLVEQSVKRATGEMFEAKPWWWYFYHAAGSDGESVNPLTMYPIYALSLYGLGVAAWRLRRTAQRRPGVTSARRAGDALATTWCVVWLMALSAFAGKRNYYLLVVHPGTAWLAAIALDHGLGALGRAGPMFRERLREGLRAVTLLALLGCAALFARVPHSVRKAHKELPVPDRDAFMEFVRGLNRPVIYNCGMPYRMAALMYIQTDIWPRSLVERAPMNPESVPSGGIMVYRHDMLEHREFGSHLDPKDKIIFGSSDGGLAYLVVERH